MLKLLIFAVPVVILAIKAFEKRLPKQVYQAGLVAYVTIPFVALGWAIQEYWGRWIGWTEFWLFVGFFVATALGSTLGYHRLLTHRSFETRRGVKAFFLILGSMGVPSGCISWAATHLKHHAHSDQEGDPHSPLDGIFHAHLGWLFNPPQADRERYCKRLLEDRLVVFIDRTPYVWFGLGLLIPYLIAGWPGLVWGGLIRTGYHNHLTGAVNSICHTFGERPFDTKDESRNNWVVGLLAFGEGFHNNHHAFPAMAYHGMSWKQPDLTALVIRLLAFLGLAWNVKTPSPELVERRRRRPEAPAIEDVALQAD